MRVGGKCVGISIPYEKGIYLRRGVFGIKKHCILKKRVKYPDTDKSECYKVIKQK